MRLAHNTHIKPSIDVFSEKVNLQERLSKGEITEPEYRTRVKALNKYLTTFVVESNKMGPHPSFRQMLRFSERMMKEAIRLHVPIVEEGVSEAMYQRTLEQVDKLTAEGTDLPEDKTT